ncbi:MAG: RidA family protein [Halioglobus sp.]
MSDSDSKEMPEANGHYSQFIQHNDLLFLSGQLPMAPGVNGAAENIDWQTSRVLANLLAVLKAAGSDKADVIQVRIYLVGVQNWDVVDKIYREFFGVHKPVRCIVPVPELHFGCLIEVEVVAKLVS